MGEGKSNAEERRRLERLALEVRRQRIEQQQVKEPIGTFRQGLAIKAVFFSLVAVLCLLLWIKRLLFE